MLTKLEIENFKSFKNTTVLDFKSTNYKILRNTNVTEAGILKGAIFVGGNATGKSNVIAALKMLLDLLFKEKRMNLGAYKCLFSEMETMRLYYQFEIQGSCIDYKIEYNTKNKVIAEKLFVNEALMLERMDETGRSYITQTEHFKQNKETLALRTIYFNTGFYEYPILKEWFEYLLNSVHVDALTGTAMDALESGVGLKEYLEEQGTAEMNAFLDKYKFPYSIEYQEKHKGSFARMEHEREKTIFFKRDGIREPIPFFMESVGNKDLLNILPAFFKVAGKGGMLLIDEFSSAFHNNLEQLLVRYFMKQAQNGQLFLVSHSTNLLSNTILRPDQEYAVEFHGKEGSLVNRFSNMKPREAQNIEKMYNEGIFGGVPLYNEI